MEDAPATQGQPEGYRYYADPLLLAAAETDRHLAPSLDGLRLAESRSREHPENQSLQKVRQLAEENVRKIITEVGYVTSERQMNETE